MQLRGSRSHPVLYANCRTISSPLLSLCYLVLCTYALYVCRWERGSFAVCFINKCFVFNCNLLLKCSAFSSNSQSQDSAPPSSQSHSSSSSTGGLSSMRSGDSNALRFSQKSGQDSLMVSIEWESMLRWTMLICLGGCDHMVHYDLRWKIKEIICRWYGETGPPAAFVLMAAIPNCLNRMGGRRRDSANFSTWHGHGTAQLLSSSASCVDRDVAPDRQKDKWTLLHNIL